MSDRRNLIVGVVLADGRVWMLPHLIRQEVNAVLRSLLRLRPVKIRLDDDDD